jgi:spore maturation protein CgeB
MLVANIFSEGCTGLMTLRALSELGHSIAVWDTNISAQPPIGDFDITFVWTNQHPDPKFMKGKKVLYYLDDPNWWKNTPKYALENVSKNYNHTFTMADFPMGCDPDIFKPIEASQMAEVAFIGTNRYQKRVDFVNSIRQAFPNQTAVFGNNWHPNIKAAYFSQMNLICNSVKIVFNEHFSDNISTKDLEVPACGGALYICDEISGLRDIYPHIPIYHTTEEAIALGKYYLEHEAERIALVNEMREQALQYTYAKQLKKILDIVEK